MIYRFGDFVLDPGRLELTRDGRVVEMEPQVFAVLALLVERHDRVVSKDDLFENVWNGRIISDAALNSRIHGARQAVGDDGRSQSLIRTYRGRGFRFVAEIIEEASPAAAIPAAEGATAIMRRSAVAVLPFENRSVDAEQEYFAHGLTEDIITDLSRFRDLVVIARNSTFKIKGERLDVAEIAKKLGARYIVEGSVSRAGGRVRIAVQLIDVTTDIYLWADRYDRELGDIFAIRDEVTRKIAATMGVRLQDAAIERALKKNTSELDAYDCLLRARRFTSALNETAHREARDLLEQSVRLDPDYGDAYALLANVYLAEHRFELNVLPDPLDRALAMAQKAAEIDPQNAYAHCWLAIAHFFRRENAQFRAEAERALNLNPNDPETLADIGHYYTFMGEFEKGVGLTRAAIELNPLHPGWYHFSFARDHYNRSEYEETLADIERANMPRFYWSHLMEAATLGQLGRPAGKIVEGLFKLKPGFSARAELEKWNAAPGDMDHILDGLAKAGI